jgi:hypothetical protein
MSGTKRAGRQRVGQLAPKALKRDATEGVRGGRTGGDRGKYLEVKLKEVLISGV